MTKTLYPGIANSPKTTIVNRISATDLSLVVVAPADLPAGPNEATLGKGDTCETVLYSQIVDGVMTITTRGFEGVAQVWDAGTQIRRAFTNYDYTALIEAAQAGGKSAYQIWLDLGYTGTEADFIAALKGAKGNTGEAGTAGTNAPAVEYQFSADSTNWHTDWTTGDTVFRFSLDGGTTWSVAIRFLGPAGVKGDTGESGAVTNIDTDSTLSANSDSLVPSQKAVKTYVDNIVAGLDWKESARCATTAAGTLSTDFAAGCTVDGVTLVAGNRILIKNQASAAENGIYVVNASGAPTRATDAATGTEISAMCCFVLHGITNADTAWVCTSDGTITVGMDAITIVQFMGGSSFSAGTGLTLNGNQFSVQFGTAAGTACQGNDSRLSDTRTPSAHVASHKTGGSDVLAAADIGAAPLNSPAFTGVPTAPTPDPATNTTQIATAAMVQAVIAALATGTLSVKNLKVDSISELTTGHCVYLASKSLVTAPVIATTFSIVASATVLKTVSYTLYADWTTGGTPDSTTTVPYHILTAGTLRLSHWATVSNFVGSVTITIYKNGTQIYTGTFTATSAAANTDINVVAGDLIRVVISSTKTGTCAGSITGTVTFCGTQTATATTFVAPAW